MENPYGEIFRTLKPGGLFACYEWLVTDNYDPNDPEHVQIIHNLERGNGISQLHTVQACKDALKSVGFEIVETCDLASPAENPLLKTAQEPWHTPLKGTYDLSLESAYRWKMTPVGRFITDTFVWAMETFRLAPPGTQKVSSMLKYPN